MHGASSSIADSVHWLNRCDKRFRAPAVASEDTLALGWQREHEEPFPPRPKGMHVETYVRLRLDHDRADRQHTEIMLADLEKMKSQLSKIGGDAEN
jgi:hypothetical protein